MSFAITLVATLINVSVNEQYVGGVEQYYQPLALALLERDEIF
jgi:hypothetical protein